MDGHFAINHFADDSKDIELRRFVDLAAEGWYSGDLYVRRPVRDAELLMLADDLHVAQFVTWWNDKIDAPAPAAEQEGKGQGKCESEGEGHERSRIRWSASTTIAAIRRWRAGFPARAPSCSISICRPRCASRKAGGEYPSEMKYILKARENPDAWVDLTTPYCWDLPMLVALGQVDSIEVLNSRFLRHGVTTDEGEGKPRDQKLYQGPFGNARWSQDIYFKLLECGLRMPPSAGSGSGVAPNPVGYNRVYVHLDGEFSYEAWWKNFRAGRVVVTNGPLMRPMVEGQPPGAVLRGEPGEKLDFEIGLTLLLRRPDQLPRHHPGRQGQAFHPPRRVRPQQGPAAQALLQAKRLVPRPRRERHLGQLPLGHDRAVLRGNRLPAAGEQAGGPVLPRLGLSSGPGRSTWPTLSSAPRCWSITARPAISGRTWSPRPTPSDGEGRRRAEGGGGKAGAARLPSPSGRGQGEGNGLRPARSPAVVLSGRLPYNSVLMSRFPPPIGKERAL